MPQPGSAAAIVYGAVGDDAPPDSRGAQLLAERVAASLSGLGYAPSIVPAGLDLADLETRLRVSAPAFVFNLVDELAGDGALIDLVPALLDYLGIAYTGCPRQALVLSSGKLLSKRLMQTAAIDTPAFSGVLPRAQPDFAGPYIVKSVWEHASVGIDDAAVVAGRADLAARAKAVRERFGGQWFAEAFIEGREFNVSVLGPCGAPVLLPLAEIVFEGYPDGKPRIVDYRAKWLERSFEYGATVRSFDSVSPRSELEARLRSVTLACWELFELNGYARIDFRVDDCGRPWVIDVNANPCLEPDAGLMAAAARAGLSFDEVIGLIVASRGEPRRPSRRPA